MKAQSSEERCPSAVGTAEPTPTERMRAGPNLPQPSKSVWPKRIAALLVISVCFFFLGKTLYGNLAQISSHQWQLRPVPLLASFVLLGANLAVSALVWKMILNLFGIRLPFSQSFKITSVSAPGKYVPGKIWLYLGQIYLSQKAQIPKGIALFSMLFLFGGYVLAGIVVFAFSLLFWEGFSPLLVAVFLLLSLCLFWVLFSGRAWKFMSGVLGRISGRFKDTAIPEQTTMDGGIFRIGQILMILLADWMIFGVAVYFLINSFHQIDVQHTIILCGIFAVSVLAGIVSFFVPAGLGVREGVQSYLLSLFIPVSAAVLISLAMRVWMVLGETGCFLAALRIKQPKLW